MLRTLSRPAMLEALGILERCPRGSTWGGMVGLFVASAAATAHPVQASRPVLSTSRRMGASSRRNRGRGAFSVPAQRQRVAGSGTGKAGIGHHLALQRLPEVDCCQPRPLRPGRIALPVRPDRRGMGDPPRFSWTGYATCAACCSAWFGVR